MIKKLTTIWFKFGQKSELIYKPWLSWLWFSCERKVIWFPFMGDEAGFIYPWARGKDGKKWVSLEFTGNGEFGDARFNTLKEIETQWNDYFKACEETSKRDTENPF